MVSFTTDTVACSSRLGLGIFHCLSDAHLVDHSARVGKPAGVVMGKPFVLSKSSRSPLKGIKDRLIPEPVGESAHGSDSRETSPTSSKSGKDDGVNSEAETESASGGDEDRGVSKPPAQKGGRELPLVSSSGGALDDVDFGGGSSSRRKARAKAVKGRADRATGARMQQPAYSTKTKAPSQEEVDLFCGLEPLDRGNGLSHPKPDSKMQRKRTGPEWAARAPSGQTRGI